MLLGYNFPMMLKVLAILALSFLVIPVQAHAQMNKAQQTSKGDRLSSPVAFIIPEHTDGPTLQPKADNHSNADVRVISTPAKDGYDKAVVWINLALAVIGTFGISAAFITLRKLERQTKATEDAVDVANRAHALAEKTAQQQLRAYIAVKNAKMLLLEDGTVEASLELCNSGQTPAYRLRVAHTCGFSAYPLPAIPGPPDDLRKSNSIVGAGGSHFILAKPKKSGPFDREGLLKEFEVNLHFVFGMRGYCSYEDIFKETHRFRFQLIAGGPSGPARLDVDEKGRIYAALCNDSEGNEET